MHIPSKEELSIRRLGPGQVESPLLRDRPGLADELEPVLVASTLDALRPALDGGADRIPVFEAAGPRPRLFFEPEKVGAGLLTCGGLCPGLNNVIRSVTMTLWHGYGVRRIFGLRYGYAGLADPDALPPIELEPETVKGIHMRGGTLLGSSRGPQDVGEMVDTVERLGIDHLYVIGGDGTLRGAHALVEELASRDTPVAVVGVPKTIDNDLHWVERSFGFATAVQEAEVAIDSAHNEAQGAPRGVGLVKLMGRNAGFIAAHASLASNDVNFCLVPEVDFQLQGEHGFLACLERRLEERDHAVIVAAEGAGQHLFDSESEQTDASGNRKLRDIGERLRAEIRAHFERIEKPVDLKYIDPSYMIRSRPANSFDSELCLVLGQHAVHAAMAGRTDMMVGVWNGCYTHVPIELAITPTFLDPRGESWLRVLEATGQPAHMGDAE